MIEIGTRVFCILGKNVDTGNMDYLGFGEVIDIEPIPTGIFPELDDKIHKGEDTPSVPVIQLDTGDVVYVGECALVTEGQGTILMNSEKKTLVLIDDIRKARYDYHKKFKKGEEVNRWNSSW